MQGQTHLYGKWAMYFILGVLLVCYVITVPIIYTQCDPIEKLWNSELPGNCNGETRGYYWAIWTGGECLINGKFRCD